MDASFTYICCYFYVEHCKYSDFFNMKENLENIFVLLLSLDNVLIFA